jgi:NAD(P)-dependent dehydrogenase (short-subunit alcohol dehydrogenase family)
MVKPYQADLSAKTCIVTGANTGIGKEIAQAFARMGAHVVLACRNEDKARRAVEDIKQATGSDSLDIALVDLSRQSDIRRFADEILDRYERIDVLVNNAGVWPTEKTVTEDGQELTFATNVLGYCLVTDLLLERLSESAPSRIVNVASTFAGGLDLTDMGFKRRAFDGAKAYKQSKQANRMWTWALAQRLEGTGVTANAIHPGPVNTQLNRDFKGLVGQAMKAFFKVFGKTPAKGADPAIFVAAAPELDGVSGQFFAGRKPIRCAFRDQDGQEALFNYCQTLIASAPA